MYGTAIDRTAKATDVRLPLTLSRRFALVIGVPACLVLVAGTGLQLAADIGRGELTVNYPIPASARQVSVSVDGGDVQLRQVSGDRASLSGTGYYSLVRPDITERYAHGTATFGYHCAVLFGNCGLNPIVSVPVGIPASVSTGGGDVTAVGVTGQITMSTDGGNVTARQVTGVLSLQTGGGDIQATGVASVQVTADTGGGDIEIVFTQVPTDVKVSTGGGDITIVVPQGTTQYDLTTQTGGGSSSGSVPTNSSSPHKITAISGGGDITIRQAPS